MENRIMANFFKEKIHIRTYNKTIILDYINTIKLLL